MSLVEVIVSLVILSLLLFSLNASQLIVLKKTQGVYYFNVAAYRIEQWLVGVDEWTDWQEENKRYLPQAVSLIKENSMVISWGGMKGECEHSVMERVGCIKMPVSR